MQGFEPAADVGQQQGNYVEWQGVTQQAALAALAALSAQSCLWQGLMQHI